MRLSFFSFITIIVCLSNANESKQILIFDSYHEGFDWSDTLITVFETELKPLFSKTELFIEHFDSKRFSLHDTSFFNILSSKYSSVGIDLIIACDDYSLDFLLKYNNQLFSNIPVVFTGINNFSDQLIENKRHLFTGVTEALNINANLQLIRSLQTGIKDILVIHDNTLSGQANGVIIEAAVSRFTDLRCHFLSGLSIEEIVEKVENLKGGWVILYASFHRDYLGHYLTAQEATAMFSSKANVPIYAINDNCLGYGVMGGYMVRARTQARLAIQVARKVLQGQSPQNLPVVKSVHSEYMFDYNQLKKFKINSKLLPPGSIIINRPQPFYRINKSVLWGVLSAVCALSIVLIFLLINIVKRKKAETALRESEGTIRQIAENINEAYWLRAKDRIIYVSPAFDDIFGFSRDEFLADPEKLIACVYEEDKDLIKFNSDTTSDKVNLDREIRIVLSSCEIRWIRYRSFPIKSSTGRIYRVAEVAEDITVKKITGDEILKAQKLESLGLLAGGIAHDFNNLLSGVMGYLDLARIAASTGNVSKIYENMEDSLTVCNRARDLTNRLLTFSKGGVPVKKIRSVNDIILNAIEMVDSKGVFRINCNLPSDLPLCNIDEGLIRQVFYNIILNACQAVNGDGFIKINAEQINEDRNGIMMPFLNITVRDNGPGIKRENISKIFDPFFTTKAKGNGLGLSAAYSILSNHDGIIRVDSKEGKETVFSILIPAVLNYKHDIMSPLTPDLMDQKKIKVLWLDDEPFITKMAESILTNFGYKVVSTTSSKIAIDFFNDSLHKGAPFDLIVLDLNIKGGVGGKDVLELILEKCPDVKAIACSGYFDDPVMSNPYKYGFKYALKKPYSSEELHKALQLVLFA